MRNRKYIDKYGSVYWCITPSLYKAYHRIDGPAVIRSTGTREWWVDGKRHRLDGPAVEWANGYKEWWIDGRYYDNFQSYLEVVKPRITEQEYFILVLTYGTEK